jgi:hypothetical protein
VVTVRFAVLQLADCLVPTQASAPTLVKRFTHLFAESVAGLAGARKKGSRRAAPSRNNSSL